MPPPAIMPAKLKAKCTSIGSEEREQKGSGERHAETRTSGGGKPAGKVLCLLNGWRMAPGSQKIARPTRHFPPQMELFSIHWKTTQRHRQSSPAQVTSQITTTSKFETLSHFVFIRM